MVSDALARMREVYESGAWQRCPDAAVVGVLAFTESVSPDLLTQEEYEFVTGFAAVLCEHGDEQAKGGVS